MKFPKTLSITLLLLIAIPMSYVAGAESVIEGARENQSQTGTIEDEKKEAQTFSGSTQSGTIRITPPLKLTEKTELIKTIDEGIPDTYKAITLKTLKDIAKLYPELEDRRLAYTQIKQMLTQRATTYNYKNYKPLYEWYLSIMTEIDKEIREIDRQIEAERKKESQGIIQSFFSSLFK